MAVKKRTWYWLLALILFTAAAFITLLCGFIIPDIEHSFISVSGVAEYFMTHATVFSTIIIIQFVIMFLLWFKIDRK